MFHLKFGFTLDKYTFFQFSMLGYAVDELAVRKIWFYLPESVRFTLLFALNLV